VVERPADRQRDAGNGRRVRVHLDALNLYRDLGFVASEDASTPELLFMACRTT
jgi:hypothetical protein